MARYFIDFADQVEGCLRSYVEYKRLFIQILYQRIWCLGDRSAVSWNARLLLFCLFSCPKGQIGTPIIRCPLSFH